MKKLEKACYGLGVKTQELTILSGRINSNVYVWNINVRFQFSIHSFVIVDLT